MNWHTFFWVIALALGASALSAMLAAFDARQWYARRQRYAFWALFGVLACACAVAAGLAS